MPYSPRSIRNSCNNAGLTHYGGVYFFHEFLRVLQFRHFLARHLTYPRRNSRYHLSQMVLALMYPIVLGLDRLETASFLRSNGTFQFLTGLPSFPDPQTLRRFLHQAPDVLWQQLHRINDRLLQTFIHLPSRRSRLIFDLDSTVVTVFGNQERAAVGYNPRYRGKKSYDPLLCMEANSSYLWDAELRPGNAGTWDGSIEVLDTSFANVPPEIRELRVRADAGFGFDPIFSALEVRPAQYAVVARLPQSFTRCVPAGRGFGGGAQILPARGSRDHAVFDGPLHLSCLGHQPVPHSRRDLALLRRTCGNGTTDLRTPRRILAPQDSYRVFRRQCAVLGDRPTRL